MASPHLGAELPRLVERLVQSYFANPGTHHIEREHLPAREDVQLTCEMLMELSYPGYHGRRGLTRHNIAYHVGELLPRLWELLVRQIGSCLCHERVASMARQANGERTGPVFLPDSEEKACQEVACSAATRFVGRMPAVRELLSSDVQAAYDGDPAAANTCEIILAYPAVLAITIHRYAHELYVLDVPLIPRMMAEYAHGLTGIDIHPGARIGRSFFVDHGTGVVIGETAVIGENVKIYQGVTLGALSFPRDEQGRLIRGAKRHPSVGNQVTIYANAIVLGGSTVIGDGSVVGGSVFVTDSVEPGHQVSITPPVLKVRPKGMPRPADGQAAPDWVI